MRTSSGICAAAIATMRRYNKFRVPYFRALLAQARKQIRKRESDREIVRRRGNPMLRYVGDATRDQTGYSEFLDTLLQAEIDYRQARKPAPGGAHSGCVLTVARQLMEKHGGSFVAFLQQWLPGNRARFPSQRFAGSMARDHRWFRVAHGSALRHWCGVRRLAERRGRG